MRAGLEHFIISLSATHHKGGSIQGTVVVTTNKGLVVAQEAAKLEFLNKQPDALDIRVSDTRLASSAISL